MTASTAAAESAVGAKTSNALGRTDSDQGFDPAEDLDSEKSAAAADDSDQGIDPAEEIPADSETKPAVQSPPTLPTTDVAPTLRPALLSERGPESIGSLSVGHPNQGYLFNAVKMPNDPQWVVSVPQHAFGTEETIRNLIHCIRHVNDLFPHSPPVFIGSISPEHGGHAPPHISHQAGRDVDVYFYYKPNTTRWYEPATPYNLDRPRTWSLLRAVITDTDVDFVLIDRSVQALLEEYALSIGEDRKWIQDIFHGTGRYPNPLIKHVPGHTTHMHIRFVSAVSRERGRLAYDSLVELGHIQLPNKPVVHTVARGETLTGVAEKYNTSVEHLLDVNKLSSKKIRVGQVLRIEERQELRDAHAPVVTPPRRLPPAEPNREYVAATLAALLQ